jgi:hypothetical protein
LGGWGGVGGWVRGVRRTRVFFCTPPAVGSKPTTVLLGATNAIFFFSRFGVFPGLVARRSWLPSCCVAGGPAAPGLRAGLLLDGCLALVAWLPSWGRLLTGGLALLGSQNKQTYI